MKIDTKGIPVSEYSQVFLQLMVNHMRVAFDRYGKVADSKGAIDPVASSLLRLAKFVGTRKLQELATKLPQLEADRNPANFVDASNYNMIGYMHFDHDYKGCCRKPPDDSPGRVWSDGKTSRARNDGTLETEGDFRYLKGA